MYKQSLPRKIFISNIDSIASKIGEIDKLSCSNKLKQMVFCAGIIECSSSLEGYIEQISSGWIQNLHKEKLTNKSLPAELRYFIYGNAVKSCYAKYLLYRDEGQFIQSVRDTNNLILHDNEEINVKDIISYAILDLTYPSVDNIQKIFKRFGIIDIFGMTSKELRTNSRFLLHMDIRGSVAHSYPPAKQFTMLDVKKHLDDIKRFIGALDRILASHFSSLSGEKCWPT